ncbi:hypothetical protein PoB_002047500 [Plakobranchus ocellatus]|uniref:Uncharacterized protein n=1 Tax=Plakobranchus ocellatus TaxID=259542 RepID=A0AAV3ZHB6_9GAST|nr:hypothetical protein PoB_002047500 [Plakobranchus ocellatus]
MSDTMKDTIRNTMRYIEGCKEGYIGMCKWKYLRNLKACNGGNERDALKSLVILGGQKAMYLELCANSRLSRGSKHNYNNNNNCIANSHSCNNYKSYYSIEKNNIQDGVIKTTEFGQNSNNETVYKNNIESKHEKRKNKQTNV